MSYKNLDIYNLSMDLFLEVHPLSLMLPKYELYELGSQHRRSADSVVSNIVEGYGRRRYQLLSNWYEALAIRLKLSSYTVLNSGSKLCLLALQTISFKCGLVSPGSDSLRASNKNHRDLRSHEVFCIVKGYGRRRYQLLSNWYEALAIRLKLSSYTVQNSGSKLCLLALQTISFKCGLVSPGSDSLRASNKNHRDLRSHEVFCIVKGYGRRRYQLLSNWYEALAIRLKLSSYTVLNSGSKLCLLALQTISFKCGLVSPGSDSLRASNKNHRDLRSHEVFCIVKGYGRRRYQLLSNWYEVLAIRLRLSSYTVQNSGSKLCLLALQTISFKCGLVSPGSDSLRASNKNHRDLRSHEVFCFFFYGKKRKMMSSLYPELKAKFAELEEKYNILGAKINRFVKYVEQNG